MIPVLLWAIKNEEQWLIWCLFFAKHALIKHLNDSTHASCAGATEE